MRDLWPAAEVSLVQMGQCNNAVKRSSACKRACGKLRSVATATVRMLSWKRAKRLCGGETCAAAGVALLEQTSAKVDLEAGESG